MWSLFSLRTIWYHILFVFINAAYSADHPHVQCCSRGNWQMMVVRQHKGPVSLGRIRHMTFKWNVCMLYIDSCSTPWECVRATNVINHLESRFCQPDNPSCLIIPPTKTTLLYSLLTQRSIHLQFPDNVNHEVTLDMYTESNTCSDTCSTYEVQQCYPCTQSGVHILAPAQHQLACEHSWLTLWKVKMNKKKKKIALVLLLSVIYIQCCLLTTFIPRHCKWPSPSDSRDTQIHKLCSLHATIYICVNQRRINNWLYIFV